MYTFQRCIDTLILLGVPPLGDCNRNTVGENGDNDTSRSPSATAELLVDYWGRLGNGQGTKGSWGTARRIIVSIFAHCIAIAVIASQIFEITQNSEKIRTYGSSRSSKVIDLGANRKRICNFLLVININFGRISYRFRDIDA